jgi:serine/threonine-protein kinase
LVTLTTIGGGGRGTVRCETVSIAPPGPSPLVPGYRLDRYELLCPIAEGGMAQVWGARLRGKHGFEKLFAIKSILPKYASDPHFQRMFLDEARIASGIDHTNVAHILDLGEEHGVLYIAMEWVDGDALVKLKRALEKKNAKIPPAILLRVLADTCAGLHAAHELRGKDGAPLGVVHRDVSPQNILVSTHGVAKLIDFGIAKARDRMAGETSAGFFKGKIHYIAPEQALGLPIDGRADVWAIGAMLYEGLAGRLPFDGPNQLATLHMLTSAKPPPPLPESIPAPVRAIVGRALTHEVGARFASAAEMRSAIERAMVETGLTASTADVAAFVAEHVSERTARRREAIELALNAAGERERMNELLVKPSIDTSSDLRVVRPSEGTMTVPDMLGKVPPSRESNSSSSGSSPGSSTLGRATLTSSAEHRAPAGGRALVFAALGGGAVVAAVTVVALLALRGSSPTAAAAASSTTAPVAQPSAPATTASIAPVASIDPAASVAPEPSSSTAPTASTGAPVAQPRPTAAKPQPATHGSPSRPAPTKAPKVFDNGF